MQTKNIKMKKILLFFALLLSVTLSAQRIQIVLDYEDGIYRGLTYTSIIQDEEDFIKDQPRYEDNFFSALFKHYKGIAYKPESVRDDEPIALVKIQQVTPKGDTKAAIEYNGETTYLTGKGGVFGSFLNLFGDGMESLGKELAKYLNKQTIK